MKSQNSRNMVHGVVQADFVVMMCIRHGGAVLKLSSVMCDRCFTAMANEYLGESYE